ncbi:two-component response regulator [Bordetella ansorpii]|uniref:Two-component response regulator n=1 Tax=Bordetella ansorpii TaxID=288768 RepID=A0A157STQ8_9BORD|nr:helix-turn-helix domain-containing protein [Bordetella ansorpii]SAI73860.1 two-component response regulator [Bordetella ansorpii]
MNESARALAPQAESAGGGVGPLPQSLLGGILSARYANAGATPLGAAPPIKLCMLSLNNADMHGHRENLRAFGFDPVSCPDFSSAARALHGAALPLLTLFASPESIHLAIGQLRNQHADAGIVAIASFPDRLSKVGALLSGADACVDIRPDPLELVATLLALHRRLHLTQPARPMEPEQKVGLLHKEADDRPPVSRWQLINGGWNLSTPNGTVLDLSHAERHLLVELLGSPDGQLKRSRDGNDVDCPPSLRGPRRNLDTVISRLRRKAAQQGVQLPIRSVRGEGYIFIDGASSPERTAQ